jgi:catechol 2,3-dioxygenase-like lactoylglutathione lyase family enzyme
VPAGFRVAPLSRASIFVRDLEASLALYRDILGLRVRVDRALDGERFDQIMGTRGVKARVRILQSGDTVYGNVGLFELAGESRPASSAPAQDRFAHTGDFAVVFLTNDIAGITARVTAAGYTIIAPPMVLFPDANQPDAKQKEQSLEMMFRDPDGVLVNLIQPATGSRAK